MCANLSQLSFGSGQVEYCIANELYYLLFIVFIDVCAYLPPPVSNIPVEIGQ